MTSVRHPAVAGLFYPADAQSCQESVQAMLAQVQPATTRSCPKALIVPHAGWQYSGSVAAIAYQQIAACAETIKRVVLLGPSHHVPLRGIAAPLTESFQTPLGEIPVDVASLQSLKDLDAFVVDETPHELEHCLEVQLPFLQMILKNFEIIPLVVGDIRKEQVAEVLGLLWGGVETIIVLSSDLSHYHSYEEANRIDSQTCERILQKRSNIRGEQACGCRAMNGLLYLADQRGLEIRQLSLTNSGDSFTGGEGDKTRVVGYGAFAIN